MDAIIVALANMGGLGILAAVLFYLHVSGTKTFKDELAKERAQCHDDHEKIMTAVDRIYLTILDKGHGKTTDAR